MRNTHPNSVEAYHGLNLGERQQIIFDIFKDAGKSLTDRQVYNKIYRSYAGDLNKVRPRITELVQMEGSPIKECGDTVCSFSDRKVRVCMYLPMDSNQGNFKFKG